YWPRMTSAGTLAGMIGGFVVYVGLQSCVYFGAIPHPGPAGIDPLLWGLAASILASIVVSTSSSPPPAELVDRYFRAPLAASKTDGDVESRGEARSPGA